MSGVVEWPQLIFVVVAVIAAGSGVLSFAIWLWSRIGRVETNANIKIDSLEKQHNDLRVKVAEEYVPFSELGKVEARIEGRLSEMAKQFERGFDRMIDILRGREP